MKYITFFCCCLLSINFVVAQQTTDLTVNINNIRAAGKGQLIIMLFDQADGFPSEMEKAKHQVKVTNFTTTGKYTFKNLPRGTYAIAVMQDKNSNNNMDKNFVGFPKEPVGAYNLNGLGRPTFARSSLVLDQAQMSVDVKMLNN